MTQPTESDILTALARYRARIAEVNHRAMLALIPQIETTECDDPGLFESPEEEDETRLMFTRGLVGVPEGNTQPPIQRPSDVLENWDVLAPQLALDGARVHPDTEWRASQREQYKSAILESLGRMECPTGQWEFPHDFEILMQHVDSLEGQGWSQLRDENEQLIFWPGWTDPEDGDRRGYWLKQARTGQEIIDTSVFPGGNDVWDVAGGWLLSETGNECSVYAMYSRPREDNNQGWSWRYVISLGQFGTEVFDDIVGVLDWYQALNEPDEQDFELTADEIFSPC